MSDEVQLNTKHRLLEHGREWLPSPAERMTISWYHEHALDLVMVRPEALQKQHIASRLTQRVERGAGVRLTSLLPQLACSGAVCALH